jgi:hypothetical protein
MVVMEYPIHGGVVLDGKMKYNKPGPSKKAIDSLVNWIVGKHIPIGGGKVRSVYKNMAHTTVKKLSKKTNAQGNRSNEITSFAFAIWYANRRRGRVKTPPTNFLRPYQNLLRNRTFKVGLVESLWKDGYGIFGEQIKRGNINEIKITM